MECGAYVKNCSLNPLEVKLGVGFIYAIIMGWLTGTEPNQAVIVCLIAEAVV